jgi:uncharacterized phiE125 gp8 family phage protein
MATSIKPPPLPVALEQVKAYLRIGGSDEDALLAGLLRSATELCEEFTRLALIEREAEEILPARPAWTRLGLTPVRSIAGISGLGPAGEGSPLPSGDYAIDIDAAGDGWVRMMNGGAGRVLVRYRAGQAADWNGIAEPLRQGIVRMAAHFYTHRDREGGAGPPAAVTALWLPYRRLRLC